jgi:hypothetical protein
MDFDKFCNAKDSSAALDMFEEELQHLSPQAFADHDWILSIPPLGSNGFATEISKSGAHVRGIFGGLEEEFSTVPVAMEWLGRAISGHYRLRIAFIKNHPIEWRLEPVSAAGGPVLVMGHPVFFRSLRRTWTQVRTNDIFAKNSI